MSFQNALPSLLVKLSSILQASFGPPTRRALEIQWVQKWRLPLGQQILQVSTVHPGGVASLRASRPGSFTSASAAASKTRPSFTASFS